MWQHGQMPAKFSSERFVGRERELSHLAVALEAASEGRSPRLLLSGRGGVGVSRLVTEMVRRVGRLEQPFQVVRCSAVPARGRAAFGPIVEGFTPWLASLDDAALAAVVGPGAEPLACPLPRGTGALQPLLPVEPALVQRALHRRRCRRR